MTATTAPTLTWQASDSSGVSHAYPSLRPGTSPVCGPSPVAVNERFAYPEYARHKACLVLEGRPIARRAGHL